MPQNNKIKIRRGLNANLPAANTEIGELRYSTDSKELYIDDGSNNVKIGGDPAGFPVSTATQTALDGKANSAHTHVATTDLTATGTKSSATYLRGDNTWATPTNTTYSEITSAEITAGTASTVRSISGRRAQEIVNKAVAASDVKLTSAIAAIQANNDGISRWQ